MAQPLSYYQNQVFNNSVHAITDSIILLPVQIQGSLIGYNNIADLFKFELDASNVTQNVIVTNTPLPTNDTIVGSNITMNVAITNTSINTNDTIVGSNITMKVQVTNTPLPTNTTIVGSNITQNVNVINSSLNTVITGSNITQNVNVVNTSINTNDTIVGSNITMNVSVVKSPDAFVLQYTTSITSNVATQISTDTTFREEITIYAPSSNSAPVLIGTASSQLFPILPGGTLTLKHTNLSLWYAQSSTTSQVLYVITGGG